jgi:hypothetical protein
MMVETGGENGNEKSCVSSGLGYFSNLSQEEVLEKIIKYVACHPEFMDELERRIVEEEHPDLIPRDMNYLLRKGFRNLDAQDVEYLSNNFAGFLFPGNKKKSKVEKTAEELLKNLLNSYLIK